MRVCRIAQAPKHLRTPRIVQFLKMVLMSLRIVQAYLATDSVPTFGYIFNLTFSSSSIRLRSPAATFSSIFSAMAIPSPSILETERRYPPGPCGRASTARKVVAKAKIKQFQKVTAAY